MNTNGNARLLLLYAPIAALAGLLFWSLADWNVYLQGSEGIFDFNFRLTWLDQLAVSAMAGALVTGVPFGVFWLVRSRAAGHSWMDRFGLLLAIGGAALGWTLLYLSGRVGGDLWTHFHFLGLDLFGYLILSLTTLLLTQGAALIVGLLFWRTPFGKAAVAVMAANALLFAAILLVPWLWNYLLHS
jgi:hypothetical protein